MPVYMVDRSLPGISMDQLAAAQKAAIETSQQFTKAGKPVRYIRTTFVPGEPEGLHDRGRVLPGRVKAGPFAGKIFQSGFHRPRAERVSRLDANPRNRKTSLAQVS